MTLPGGPGGPGVRPDAPAADEHPGTDERANPDEPTDLGEDRGLDEHGDVDLDGDPVEFTVRPYTLTGGRTRPTSDDLPFEALVEAVAEPVVSMTPERRRILELARGQYVSLAELSAHLHLPLGVVRVVVGDLADAGQVRVHGTRTGATAGPASTISVLESVLHGIFSL